MFRDNTRHNIEHVNFLHDWGGIGDNVASLPVYKYILENYPHIIPHIWYPDYFVNFAKHCLPKAIIKPFSKGEKEFNTLLPGRKISNPQHTNMGTHLVDNAFHILIDKSIDIQHKNYVQLDLNKINIEKFNLPENYVVISTGYTAIVREMKAQVVNELSDYVISKGYIPVYLGSKVTDTGVSNVSSNEAPNIIGNFNTEIDYSKGLDLIDKTSLLESGKIIAGAKCIVGLDNGLLHLAGCTNTTIVGGFTTVEPRHRMPYRNNELGWNFYSVVPDENLKCRFCQSNWEFKYGNDFRKCYYVEQKLDKEIQCTKNLTSNKFINQLEKVL